ncbi:hypothetical protein [Liquorilactobacillus vini]|uniref:Uncharacterized protein n=1 Tax=Liquorilactobacillus vini DSM 20605 TaxID=1133569 RepID=A0A0R2BQ08_9LACO|nr:hypothetical protein [Liquorilactobacillus vini]KRM81457.1 hypothetical protein FD21_GL000666 [Liquorilactobacillus vini DSM 20605]
MQFTGCGILLSTVNQAKEVWLEKSGYIKDGDLNIFDRGLNLKETYSLGRRFLD